MIKKYTILDAFAEPDPKFISITEGMATVYTGDDIPPLQQESRIIQTNQLRDRFTDTEMDAALALAYGGDVVARRVLLKLQTASDGVDLDSPAMQQGMLYLVSKGVITAARKEELLK